MFHEIFQIGRASLVAHLVKNLPAMLGLTPGLGRSPREGKGYLLQYSDLENSMDCIVHGVVKSQTQLSSFHFHFALRPQVCNCQLPADTVLRTAGGVHESDTVQKI